MSEQLPQERFERLAKLVGRALAERWMRVLSQRCNKKKGPQSKPVSGRQAKSPELDPPPDGEPASRILPDK